MSSTPIEFQIKVDRDAPTGTFSGIQCRITSQSGNEVSYVVAQNTTLRIYERGKLKRSREGKLLSPLEALRQGQGTQ